MITVSSWLDAPKVVIPRRLAPLSLFEKEALKLAHSIIGATEITIASFGRVLGTQSCQVLLDLVGKRRNSVFGEDSHS